MLSVSNNAGPYWKFSAPKVTNNAIITTIDTLVVARINSLILYRDSSGYTLARKDAVNLLPVLLTYYRP